MSEKTTGLDRTTTNRGFVAVPYLEGILLGFIVFALIAYYIPFATWSRPLSHPFEKTAMVTFSSDDGRAEDLNSATVMREAGFRMTFYVVSSWVGMPGYMAYSDLLKLQTEGFEIASHSMNHSRLTDLPLDEAEDQIVTSKLVLELHGLHVHCFAFPFGAFNSTLDAIAGQTYDYVRRNYSELTPDSFDVIDEAIANRTWLNLSFHAVDGWGFVLPNGPMGGVRLADVVSYASQKGLPVVTEIQGFYMSELMGGYT